MEDQLNLGLQVQQTNKKNFSKKIIQIEFEFEFEFEVIYLVLSSLQKQISKKRPTTQLKRLIRPGLLPYSLMMLQILIQHILQFRCQIT